MCTLLWPLPLRKMAWRVKEEEEAIRLLFLDGSLITLSDNGVRTRVIQKVELKLALAVGTIVFSSSQGKEHSMKIRTQSTLDHAPLQLSINVCRYSECPR